MEMKKHSIEINCNLPHWTDASKRLNRLEAIQASVEQLIADWGGDLAAVTIRSEPARPGAESEERVRVREAMKNGDVQGVLNGG